MLYHWFPSISDNGPKATSRKVCGATSENSLKSHRNQLLCTLNTHTHTFNSPFSGTTRVNRYQKGKTNLDFTEARDSEWQWHQLGHMHVCISLQTDKHASTPPLKFFTGRMPFLPPNQQRQSTEGTLNTNLLMPRSMYLRLSYPTLLLWVVGLNTNMVKIKYARPKILAGHLVESHSLETAVLHHAVCKRK